MTLGHIRLGLYVLAAGYLGWTVAAVASAHAIPLPPIWPAFLIGPVLADGIDTAMGTHGQ